MANETFELKRFVWATPDRLEIDGRFVGLGDGPTGDAVLVLRGPERTHRLPAVDNGAVGRRGRGLACGIRVAGGPDGIRRRRARARRRAARRAARAAPRHGRGRARRHRCAPARRRRAAAAAGRPLRDPAPSWARPTLASSASRRSWRARGRTSTTSARAAPRMPRASARDWSRRNASRARPSRTRSPRSSRCARASPRWQPAARTPSACARGWTRSATSSTTGWGTAGMWAVTPLRRRTRRSGREGAARLRPAAASAPRAARLHPAVGGRAGRRAGEDPDAVGAGALGRLSAGGHADPGGDRRAVADGGGTGASGRRRPRRARDERRLVRAAADRRASCSRWVRVALLFTFRPSRAAGGTRPGPRAHARPGAAPAPALAATPAPESPREAGARANRPTMKPVAERPRTGCAGPPVRLLGAESIADVGRRTPALRRARETAAPAAAADAAALLRGAAAPIRGAWARDAPGARRSNGRRPGTNRLRRGRADRRAGRDRSRGRQSAPLEWPPASAAAVQALTDAVAELERELLAAGWVALEPGAGWFAKRFAWKPVIVVEPAPPAVERAAVRAAAPPAPAVEDPPSRRRGTGRRAGRGSARRLEPGASCAAGLAERKPAAVALRAALGGGRRELALRGSGL